MATQKNKDISVIDFVRGPACRYTCLAISLVALALTFTIPWPHYVETEGVIASAETLSDSLRNGSRGPRRLRYWVNVEYNVNGEDFKIKTILNSGQPVFEQRPIKMFYDMKNPRNGVLAVPGFSIHTMLILIFVLMGGTTGLLFWWCHQSEKLNEEQAQANRDARNKVLVPTPIVGQPRLFQIECPRCDTPLHYQVHLAGHKVRCSQCEFLIGLPAVAMRQQQIESQPTQSQSFQQTGNTYANKLQPNNLPPNNLPPHSLPPHTPLQNPNPQPPQDPNQPGS